MIPELFEEPLGPATGEKREYPRSSTEEKLSDSIELISDMVKTESAQVQHPFELNPGVNSELNGEAQSTAESCIAIANEPTTITSGIEADDLGHFVMVMDVEMGGERAIR